MAALLRGNLLRDLAHAISASRECLGPCVDTAIRVSEGKKVVFGMALCKYDLVMLIS